MLSFFPILFFSAARLLQTAMIQECDRAGCLKKNNISHLAIIETGRLNKVRVEESKFILFRSTHSTFELAAAN